MPIVLPLVADQKLIGSAFVAGCKENIIAVATTLHQIALINTVGVVIPPHGGDLSQVQIYPIGEARIMPLHVAMVDYFNDLAILLFKSDTPLLLPRYIASPRDVKVGEEVISVGYPYSILGSLLETAEICHVSALGQKQLPGGHGRHEFILSRHSYIGSSGSPVVRKSDGVVCGVIRGCLAPPGLLSVGGIPIGSDSSVTYATSAHVIPQLVSEAFSDGVPFQ